MKNIFYAFGLIGIPSKLGGLKPLYATINRFFENEVISSIFKYLWKR
jgi:hypothetical protein